MNLVQKQIEPKQQQNETKTRRQKVFSFFKDKKEWTKLNGSYLVGSAVNFGTALASAHIAQKAGISKESASSWISFISGFTVGFSALVGSWYFLHVDRYQKDIGKITNDAWEMFKNIWKAQIISFGIIIPSSWLLAKEGLPTTVIVTAQQILDKVIFIPAFNFFSRAQIRKMEKE